MDDKTIKMSIPIELSREQLSSLHAALFPPLPQDMPDIAAGEIMAARVKAYILFRFEMFSVPESLSAITDIHTGQVNTMRNTEDMLTHAWERVLSEGAARQRAKRDIEHCLEAMKDVSDQLER